MVPAKQYAHKPTGRLVVHLTCIAFDIAALVILCREHKSFLLRKDSRLPLIVFAGVGIAIEVGLIALAFWAELYSHVRFYGRIGSAVINFAMFTVHLIMPIVIITTWKGYYYLRLRQSFDDSVAYYSCDTKDVQDWYNTYMKCLDEYDSSHGALKFPHGDVDSSCILFWVICALHLLLAGGAFCTERKSHQTERELRREAKNIELQDRNNSRPETQPFVEDVGDNTVVVRD